jgi:hypothetical protein
MKFEISTPLEPAEAKKLLAGFIATLCMGSVLVISTILTENHGFHSVAGLLLLIQAVVSLILVALAVLFAGEPILRTLTLVSLVAVIAPVMLFVFIELSHVEPGGHDAGTFSFMAYLIGCWVSGVPLLIVAGVRFAVARRKR